MTNKPEVPSYKFWEFNKKKNGYGAVKKERYGAIGNYTEEETKFIFTIKIMTSENQGRSTQL